MAKSNAQSNANQDPQFDINALFEQYKSELQPYIELKSISTNPKYKDEVVKTAKWLQDYLENLGFKVEIIKGYSNPIVYAYYEVDPNAKTILVYGHYDVQPASKEDGWASDPFTLTEKNGKLIARGIVDNKGQTFIHIFSVAQLIKQGKLAYNVKFLIEGNEETGSEGISKLLNEESQKENNWLTADIIIISDGEMPYKPMITASFRGTFNVSLKVKTANNNLHSGLYGGPTPNAGLELVRILNKLWDSQYKVTIPNFYNKDGHPSKKDIEIAKQLDKVRQPVLKHTGVKKFFNYLHNSFSLTVGMSTMFTISGIKVGYIGDGYSNIIPAEAVAKLNFRIAHNQKPQEVLDMVKEHINKIKPDYVELEFFDIEAVVDPIMVNVNGKDVQHVISLLERVYNDKVLIDYCGATLPIVVDIKKVLKKDPILVSLGNDDCNMHGVNENFDIELIKKGIEFSLRFFKGD